MKIKFEKGDTLIAIDECIMDDTNLPALEIGRKYTIINPDDGEGRFTIIDDFGDEHKFYNEANGDGEPWYNFFSIANPK